MQLKRCVLLSRLRRCVSILIGLPLLLYSRLEDKEYIHFVSYRMCLEEWPSPVARMTYAAVIMLLQFVVPVVVLIIIHWRICNFLKTRILQVCKNQHSGLFSRTERTSQQGTPPTQRT